MFARLARVVVVLLVALLAASLIGCGAREQETSTDTPETRSQTMSETADPEGETEITGETPARQPGETGVAEGQFPPPFSLPDLEGNLVSVADFGGKVVVLDLWATWCPPCKAEIPHLIELYDEFKDHGLVVVGVGLDRGGASVIKPFVEAQGINYPVLIGNDEVSRAYSVASIPTTFIIDKSGKIAKKHVGFHSSMARQLRSEVAALLGVAAEGV